MKKSKKWKSITKTLSQLDSNLQLAQGTVYIVVHTTQLTFPAILQFL